MSTATLTRKTDVSGDTIVAILRDCRIASGEWEEWLALTLFGVRPSFVKLIHRGNRGKALAAILDKLSSDYYAKMGIKFPPPGWKPSKRQLAAVG
jgi:hypothetical protein